MTEVTRKGRTMVWTLWGFLSVALVGAVTTVALAGEKQTINAFSVWSGEGTVYTTGVNEATFVGALTGPLFVETEEGPAESGWIDCLGMLEIELSTAKQAGDGKCTFTADDGARAFADWSCKGVHLVGCKGEMTFTEGTERFEGIKGGGSMVVRSSLGKTIEAMVAGELREEASGIAIWRELTYELP